MKKALNNDILLLYDMQNGSKRAFDSIFRKYYPILCYYARHFLTQEDAEEVVQDILLWIWENKHELTIDYSLKQYLFRMLHHRCINKILQNEAKLKADTAFYQKTMEALHDTDVAQVNELSRHIKEAINALPAPLSRSLCHAPVPTTKPQRNSNQTQCVTSDRQLPHRSGCKTPACPTERLPAVPHTLLLPPFEVIIEKGLFHITNAEQPFPKYLS